MPTLAKLLVFAVALSAGAGCTRNAPSLPPDVSNVPVAQRLSADDRNSAEFRLSCAQVTAAVQSNRAEAARLESVIESERGRNQAVIFIAGAAGAAFAAQSDAEKARLNVLQEKKDRLLRIAAAKNCPVS